MNAPMARSQLTDENLWDWWASSGSQNALDSLMQRFDPLAQSMADRAARTTATDVDPNALLHWARSGLALAIEQYVDHRACMFEPFAIPRVRQRIIDELGTRNEELPDPAGSLLHQVLVGADLRSAFTTLLDTVDARERAVLSLYYLDGLDTAEIAVRLGRSIREVTEVHLRAMEQLSADI